MSDYGVTYSGFNIKRADKILEELQAEFKDKFGFDVSLNKQSVLNVMLTAFSDRLALLWEVAQQVYYAHYPNSAEGVSLDYACLLSGVLRKKDTFAKIKAVVYSETITELKSGDEVTLMTTPELTFTVAEDTTIDSLVTSSELKTVIDALSGDKAIYCSEVKLVATTYGECNLKSYNSRHSENEIIKLKSDNAEGFVFELESEGSTLSTDEELRNLFINRLSPSRMSATDSMAYAIYNVNGVKNVRVNETTEGIQVIVEGGSEKEIAKAIFASKTPGIPTLPVYGTKSETTFRTIENEFGDIVDIVINRPYKETMKFRIATSRQLTYAEEIKIVDAIADYCKNYGIGDAVYTQDLVFPVKNAVLGLGNISILVKSETGSYGDSLLVDKCTIPTVSSLLTNPQNVQEGFVCFEFIEQ